MKKLWTVALLLFNFAMSLIVIELFINPENQLGITGNIGVGLLVILMLAIADILVIKDLYKKEGE